MDAYRTLRVHGSPLPVFADESCLDEHGVAGVAGLVDGVVVKTAKTGGIAGARRQLRAAREHGLATMLGCMIELRAGIAAAAQLASLADHVDLDGHLLLAGAPRPGVDAEGRVLPGDGPGVQLDRVS